MRRELIVLDQTNVRGENRYVLFGFTRGNRESMVDVDLVRINQNGFLTVATGKVSRDKFFQNNPNKLNNLIERK